MNEKWKSKKNHAHDERDSSRSHVREYVKKAFCFFSFDKFHKEIFAYVIEKELEYNIMPGECGIN